MIVAYPGVSGADLARLTFLTPQTINVIVRNLERMGAIRKSADAEHGRILRLTATAKGQALLKRCRARVREVEDRLAALVGRDDEKVVRRWLSAVGEALGKGYRHALRGPRRLARTHERARGRAAVREAYERIFLRCGSTAAPSMRVAAWRRVKASIS